MNVRVTSRAAAALAGTLAVLALTACGSDAVSSDDAKKSVDQAAAAIEIAAEKVSGTAFELEENGRNGWEVSVEKDGQVTEVRVNQAGDKVTSTEDDGRIDLDDGRRLASATVPIVDALQTAAKEATGIVESVELDRRLTTVTWVVQLDDGEDDIEVYVDAATGKVAKVERD